MPLAKSSRASRKPSWASSDPGPPGATVQWNPIVHFGNGASNRYRVSILGSSVEHASYGGPETLGPSDDGRSLAVTFQVPMDALDDELLEFVMSVESTTDPADLQPVRFSILVDAGAVVPEENRPQGERGKQSPALPFMAALGVLALVALRRRR